MSKTRTIIKSLLVTIVSLLMLAAAGIAQAQPFAYITNQVSDNVSVINTATNTVVATVAVGFTPRGVAVNPAGTHGILCLEGAPVLVSVAIRHLPRDHRDSNTSALA